ncbi:hypothetical protein SD70_07260 [Gordoniibacillus kamchatkensis]|uniref:HTH araC/xylS-type domain-containing protein n=1 Tax=Gordoniibacillus kamchatkensis TaxID=1590651 RepID=A0ABR5AK71_9BACL|nr:AraC family transcriptional regulator [Paenibacillus sp. VKM B-2647]KIL41432.1 hypothetical protein SD70_07260 [Paenibacillus sp. VKM B-2647]
MQEYAYEFAENIYLTPDDFDKDGGVWPIRLGRNIAKPNYHAGPRIIDYYSLHIVRSGAVQLTYGDQCVRLGQGDIFCLFPHVPYSYKIAASDDPLQLAWIAIDGKQVPALLSRSGLHEHTPYLKSVVSKKVESVFHQLFRTVTNRELKHRLNSCSLLYRLLGLLVCESAARSDIDAEPGDWIGKSISYMNTHYTENINVQDVASHVGIHRSYYSKKFTEYVGMTPVRYLQKLRMDKAMRLLEESSLTITEIGLSLGYSDSPSFTRAFGNYYGVPPTHFRK